MKTFQVEQGVRTLVDEQLKNLDWTLTSGKNCNVFQEQPRTVEERKRLKGKRPDYVLYSKDSSRKEPLIIIETKKPGANLDEALKQGDEYAGELGAPIVFATDGVYYKTLHTKKHRPLFLNGEEVDELFRELEAIKFLEDNEVNTISKEVIYDRQQLIGIFEDSNNLLRDEGFRAGIERFGEFSNILFLKLIGELEDLKEEEGRNDEVVLDKYLRWSQWKNKKGEELLNFVNDTVLPKIGKAYEDEDIFTSLKIQNPEILKKIIEKLDPLNLINIDSDIKGDSFEYFLKQSTATKNDLGEYFTPRHIVKVMVKLLNPQIGETIYDPFCGTGGTLIETFKHISHNMAHTKVNWKQLRENTLFGNEITTTARITKMNMILIGDGHSGIQQKNSLKNPDEVENKYDIVVTNMPYSQKTEYGSYYDLPSTNGDSICVQHCIKAIDKASENGRMALIVPEGFLFRKDLQKTREYLLDRCVLKSVISLPQGVFLPYTGVKTNILYCTDVKKKKRQEKFWYFDVKNDGYSLDSHRRKLEGKTDLQKLLEYRKPEDQNQKDILKVGFLQISMEEVKKNDYVLSGNRYKKIFDFNNVPWEIYNIGEICEIINGSTPSTKEKKYWDNGNIPWFTIEDIREQGRIINKTQKFITREGFKNSSLRLLPKNTVLLCCTASVGEYAINEIELTTNQQFNGLVIKKGYESKILPKFLFWAVANLKEELQKYVSSSFSYVSVGKLKKIDIPIPPIEVQKEIVKELDSYQKVIDGARQVVENYKPNIEVKDEWGEVELGTVCIYEGGTQPPKNTFKTSLQKGYIRLLQIRDYKSDNRAVYIPTNERHKTCDATDIMIGRYGPPVFQILKGKKGAYNVALIKTVPDETKLQKKWLYYFLISDPVQEHIISLSERARQAGVSPKDLNKLLIPLPDIEEQKEIVISLEEEENLINQNIKIIDRFKKKIQKKLDFIWGK